MTNVITVLVAVLAAAGGMLALSLSRNRKLSGEKRKAIKIAENLVTLRAKEQKIQKETTDEKTALAKTPDADLLRRANNLFS